MHWRIDFEQCGAFSTDGDAQTATVLFKLTQDEQDLGRWAAHVKVPSSADNLGLDFMEVAPPRSLGYVQSTPRIPHSPYRDAVVAYMIHLLWRIHNEPGSVEAFRFRGTAEFESDVSDEAGW